MGGHGSCPATGKCAGCGDAPACPSHRTASRSCLPAAPRSYPCLPTASRSCLRTASRSCLRTASRSGRRSAPRSGRCSASGSGCRGTSRSCRRSGSARRRLRWCGSSCGGFRGWRAGLLLIAPRERRRDYEDQNDRRLFQNPFVWHVQAPCDPVVIEIISTRLHV
jgi:hypothetical protein